MTINATPPISANSGAAGTNIALEFGWTTPFSLATKTPRATVPTSGFNVSAFEGKSNLTVTASPTAVSGSAGNTTAGSNVTVTTNANTITPVGGSGSYTYAWTLVSGAAATLHGAYYWKRGMTVPSVAVGTVTVSGVYRCTVTDTVSGATAYCDVTVNTTANNLT